MLDSLLSIFLKNNCPLCQRPTDEYLCCDCQKQLRGCQFSCPQKFWQGELPLFVWGRYEGKLKQAIAALKYDSHRSIGEVLGFFLGETWQASHVIKSSRPPVVIPIPLHYQKQQERGFNQAEIIAKGFCQITKYPLLSKALRRIRPTETMFGLTPQQRQRNLRQAFALDKSFHTKLKSRSILLLDDIYTTGTTATEAAKVLTQKGSNVLGILAVSTPRH